ncbi:MAG: hypothetical protein PHQ72_13395 [Hespellia sp.]|nr:hypothetical protein [Hespellia sp.]
MTSKLPYYMTYPMPYLFDDDKKETRDIEYLRSLYPLEAKQLLPYIEDECDRMMYEGCMLYDEYPDKLQLKLMLRRIVKKADLAGELVKLAEVMLYQELYERRCQFRKECHKNY